MFLKTKSRGPLLSELTPHHSIAFLVPSTEKKAPPLASTPSLHELTEFWFRMDAIQALNAAKLRASGGEALARFQIARNQRLHQLLTPERVVDVLAATVLEKETDRLLIHFEDSLGNNRDGWMPRATVPLEVQIGDLLQVLVLSKGQETHLKWQFFEQPTAEDYRRCLDAISPDSPIK